MLKERPPSWASLPCEIPALDRLPWHAPSNYVSAYCTQIPKSDDTDLQSAQRLLHVVRGLGRCGVRTLAVPWQGGGLYPECMPRMMLLVTCPECGPRVSETPVFWTPPHTQDLVVGGALTEAADRDALPAGEHKVCAQNTARGLLDDDVVVPALDRAAAH